MKFKFIKITNQEEIIIYSIDIKPKDKYSKYYALRKSIDCLEEPLGGSKTLLNNIYGFSNSAEKFIPNIFTPIFWNQEYPISENFILYKRNNNRIDKVSNYYISSLTNKDINNILDKCKKYNYVLRVRNEI